MVRARESNTIDHTSAIKRTIDSSYLKLKWNIQGLFDKITLIIEEISQRFDELPEKNTRERGKIRKWLEELNTIFTQIENIKEIQLGKIERKLDNNFIAADLVILSFIQPSITRVFVELKDYFVKNSLKSVKKSEFDDFRHLADASRVLALIGDAVIDLALFEILWDPSISKVGDLHDRKVEIAQNKNLARFCDSLRLYESRVQLDDIAPTDEKKILHTKGTIVEALFGVIYIERGFESVISKILVLK